MDNNDEYHDPDYPEASINVKEEAPTNSEEDKVNKIKQIIRREFRSELNARENEVNLIDQRMTSARTYLHQVRYALVNNYYRDQKLQLTGSQIEEEIASQENPRTRAEVATLLRESQCKIHPSVRKLIGKKTVDLNELMRSRAPRNKYKKNYTTKKPTKNVTISADSTKSLRPDKEVEEPSSSVPKKIPRHRDPKANNVVTLDEVTRNKKKHKYRIIIGNTSKFAPPASRLDRSTHKWLLYVRGPQEKPDLSQIVTAVDVQLHHSYAPHHTVHIDKPPFHVSRRGWGEFPAKVTIHFVLPDRNRPATITHTIKLDRHYTGLQTLGAETLANVWLYSTPEMLEFEYKVDEEQSSTPLEEIKQEVPETINETSESNIEHNQTETIKAKNKPSKTIKANLKPSETVLEKFKPNELSNDDWLDFFSKDTTEVNVDEMFIKNIKQEPIDNENVNNTEVEDYVITENGLEKVKTEPDEKPKKKIMKYMDPTTRKIYYLEMDRTLDLSNVQEIVINSEGESQTAKISPIKSNGLEQRKKPVSLLKPEAKKELIDPEVWKNEFSHIENDHCYLATNYKFNRIEIKERKFSVSDELKVVIDKLQCVRVIVSYLLKKIPLIIQDSSSDYLKCLPFVVDSDERYWKLDFAKRRNMEWSRAKLINQVLSERFKNDVAKIWRTKQILVYSRLHGYYPVRPESNLRTEVETNDWSSWNDLESSRQIETSIRKKYPNASDICSLTLFNSEYYVPKDLEIQDLCESDEDIDILNTELPFEVKNIKVEEGISEEVLPVDKDDKLRFFYIEKVCSDIGIELRNENIGSDYSYSAVHSVILTAVKCFAEELIRASLAEKLSQSSDPQLPTIWSGSSSRARVSLQHVLGAARAPRLRVLAARALAAPRHRAHTV